MIPPIILILITKHTAIFIVTERTRHLFRPCGCGRRSSEDLFYFAAEKAKKPDKSYRRLSLLPYPAHHFRRMICPPSKHSTLYSKIQPCQDLNLFSQRAFCGNTEFIFNMSRFRRYVLRSLNKSQHILRRMKAVKQSIRNAVIPIDWDRDKTGMNFLPTFNRKQNISRLRTAVKY